MRYIAILMFLVGCSAETQSEPEKSEPVSCEVIARGEQDLVLKFSDPDIAAPGGLSCVSLGGGEFDCKPDYCSAVYYPGNCPQCPYTPFEGSSGE